MKNSAELYSKILLKYLQTNKGDLEGVKRYSDLMFLFNAILATTKAEREMNIFKELIEKQFKNEEMEEEGQNLAPFVCSCLEIKD
uniref:Uncharacterized protein n=1 Tax=Meloidogyne enterolobii TaxID=390850 RepID=A0A6V7XRE5_MELEN|nr:unnamed protein product [Meloidogyne enterolobii]